jgi:hypothetical protein
MTLKDSNLTIRHQLPKVKEWHASVGLTCIRLACQPTFASFFNDGILVLHFLYSRILVVKADLKKVSYVHDLDEQKTKLSGCTRLNWDNTRFNT